MIRDEGLAEAAPTGADKVEAESKADDPDNDSQEDERDDEDQYYNL